MPHHVIAATGSLHSRGSSSTIFLDLETGEVPVRRLAGCEGLVMRVSCDTTPFLLQLFTGVAGRQQICCQHLSSETAAAHVIVVSCSVERPMHAPDAALQGDLHSKSSLSPAAWTLTQALLADAGTYTHRFAGNARRDFANVRLPFNEFRPEAGVQAALDPANVHRLAIRRDCRLGDARSQPDFSLELLRLKVCFTLHVALALQTELVLTRACGGSKACQCP